MGFSFAADERAFRDAMDAIEDTIAHAATAAIRQAATTIRARGDANIRAAGFSSKWEDSLKVALPRRDSINASALIFDTIPYFGIFEDGGVIQGQPLLWLPLPSVPRGIGGRPLSPRDASARFGGLISIHSASGAPLLAAKVGDKTVALFIGVDRVTIRKRFAVRAIIEDVVETLPELFEQNLKAA